MIRRVFGCFLPPRGGGVFEKPNSAFDRARRALSETMFGQTWSNPQTNRPWVYRNLQIFWGFLSCFLRISPLRGGIFEKPNRPSDRARRVASWSSFGQTVK